MFNNENPYKPVSKGSSIRTNLLVTVFLVLAGSGIIINLAFIHVLRTALSSSEGNNNLIENAVRQFTVIGSGITIAGILIALFIALYISEKITEPIKKLTDSMLDMAGGKWDTRINISGRNEFGQLAEGFNFMARHIEDSMDKLNTAKEYTDNIVISVPSILTVLSNQLNILSTNKAFERLNEQYPQLSLNQFITPLENDIKKNLNTGDTIKKEIVIVPEGSGTSLIFSAIISRIGNSRTKDDEEKARILLTITDITERRKMKEMVLQSRQDWEDTFNTIPDMITIHDRDFNIILANKAAKETLNMPILDFKKINKCYEYYHGTKSAPIECPSCGCLKTEEPAAFEIYEPHLKKYVEIRAIPRFNNDHKLIGLIHIVRDISVRKKIEDEHNNLLVAITKAKIEWEMTFDSALEFILLIDNELKISRCNKSFSEYVNKPVNNIVGHHCYDFFSCSPSQVEDCKSRMTCSRELPAKNELETETGRWLYISHRPIQDEKEKKLKSVIIATDITELKNAQQRIRESERELKTKVDDLEKFYEMAIGRELRMKELKKEIKRLNRQLGIHEEINIA
ncbi:MAG: PAS domain-containing protein [Nitrospiraceae bacterium]|nr:MAG: PAS domain-containing protein [Nitrospiraceae bacterium]